MLKMPWLANGLSFITSGNSDENAATYDYEALTPSVIEPDKSMGYIEALNFACSRSDIRNIAVTGPYGAGKSSVLLTWVKCPDNEQRVMTVSLADFHMQGTSDIKPGTESTNNEGDKAEGKSGVIEEKTIEYSILQQLLYKEKKSSLPYSRIERISDITSSQVAGIAGNLLLLLTVTVAGLLCLFPDYIRKKLSLPAWLSQFLLDLPVLFRLGGAGLLLFVALFLLLKKLHRIGLFDRRVSVDKVDMLKGAISTRPSSPSLLNVYIDEIVYFFEQTSLDVVIFEDLDRYNDGAIFIKLREINQIINNCLPVDKPVRFIYAIRDELFKTPESRTKFFDFVIPVIPVMDSENASEHFNEKFTDDELSQSDFKECLSRLSMFIPDMRVMHKIANEFRLYRNIVNNAQDINRLVSLISYKNLCAEDYHGIDRKTGVVYSFTSAYTSGKLQNLYEERINKKISIFQSELNEIKNETTTNESELRKDVLKEYISEKTKSGLCFSTGNGKWSLDDLVNDETQFLSMLASQTVFIHVLQYNSNMVRIQNQSLQQLKINYENRIEKLNLKAAGRIKTLEGKIETLNQNIHKLKQKDIVYFTTAMSNIGFSDWVNENIPAFRNKLEHSTDKVEQIDFIYFLLCNGYLSTDYMSYRSIFMPGSLSSSDNLFIRSVSAAKPFAETVVMPLEKIENVICKLSTLNLLLRENAWHPLILIHLLQHNSQLLSNILIMQTEEGEAQRLVQLAELTFKNWSTAETIHYVQLMTDDINKSTRLMERLWDMNDTNAAFQLVMLLMCVPDLQWNHETIDMREQADDILTNYDDFLDKVPEGYAQQFIDNLSKTSFHLSRLHESTSVQGRNIVRDIVKSKLWQYSGSNLRNIILSLSDRENIKEIIAQKPLASVELLDIPSLKEMINANIESFVKEFFLASHEYERVSDFLNHRLVSFQTASEIIKKMDFKIDDISLIEDRKDVLFLTKTLTVDISIYGLLLENDRVKINWSNVIHLINQDYDLNPPMAIWFERIYKFLDSDIPSPSLDLFSRLVQRLYISGAISDNARRLILTSIDMQFSSLPENLRLDGAVLLVEYKRLEPSAAVYKQVYKAFHDQEEGLSLLLAELVTQNPALLQAEPELVLINDGKFEHLLAEKLFRDSRLSLGIRIRALNWLWDYNSDLFDGPLFIPTDIIKQLLPGLPDDKMRRLLLVQCLKAGSLPHDEIILVLRTLLEPDYQSFLSHKAHRSVRYSDPLWQLAVLLDSAGFIRSLSRTTNGNRIRFVPHNSPAYKRE